MRKLLIICILASLTGVVACNQPVAASQQMKAMKEALAAANAYYAKTTKDCGSYRYAYGSFTSIVAYKGATKDARIKITDGAQEENGLEWRAAGTINAKSYGTIGLHGEIIEWRPTYGKPISGEGVMIEKRNGQITYNGHPLSALTPPALRCQ